MIKTGLELVKESDLIIIDGYGFVFRAFHSLPPLTTSDGTHVGAVYGFTSMLLKLISDFGAKRLVVVFDSGQKTFRHDMYAAYKANRPEVPDSLKQQFPIMREVTEAFSIRTIEKPGFEADDIIASFAKYGKDNDLRLTIISSDKDLMQLLSDNIHMLDPIKQTEIDRAKVIEKFGVGPEQLLDLLAIIGDSSDNVPGIKGIGPKTAAELLIQYGNLENIFENLDKIKQQRRKELLTDGKESAILSKQLITLDKNVPLEFKPEHYQIHNLEPLKISDFLHKYNFKSLISKVEKVFGINMPADNNKIEVISCNLRDCNYDLIYKDMIWHGKIALYITNVKEHYNLSIHVPDKTYFLEFQQDDNHEESMFAQKLDSKTLELLIKIFAQQQMIVICYDSKNLMHILYRFGIRNILAKLEDTMFFLYLLYGSSGNSELEKYIPAETPILHYAHYINQIFNQLYSEIHKNKQFENYYNIILPLAKALFAMEKNGVRIDANKLKLLSTEFEEDLNKISKEIFALAGRQFNIGSPKQLSEVLFGIMQLPSPKKSKSGNISTDANVLEDLEEQGHEIASHILEWRTLSKLKSTYTDALPKNIDPLTGRVHSSFTMTLTSTGRLSSNNPNLQNIPIRSEQGIRLREAFIAPPGKMLISADYSQIELRLMAHLADIKPMQDAFKHGKDIHTATAAQIFGINEEDVDANHRRKAKAINFGIIYGISSFGLAKQLKISRKDAGNYISSYLAKYSGIEAFMERTKEFARQNSYVETIFKRKCFIGGMQDKNSVLRAFSERAAINAPLQGSAADIINKAMVRIQSAIDSKAIEARMILQIHDELLFEVDEYEAKPTAEKIKQVMENVVQLKVPLKVDASIGKNWREL